MTTTVGIVGFGRIGRNLFRLLYEREDVRIGAISDWNDPDPLEYLLRFDTQLGRFPGVVSIRDGYLYAAGRQIRMICECGRDECERVIAITVAEYEQIRSDPIRFAVTRAHVMPDVEEVVDRTDRFVVVTKREGTPTDIAIDTDPRS